MELHVHHSLGPKLVCGTLLMLKAKSSANLFIEDNKATKIITYNFKSNKNKETKTPIWPFSFEQGLIIFPGGPLRSYDHWEWACGQIILYPDGIGGFFVNIRVFLSIVFVNTVGLTVKLLEQWWTAFTGVPFFDLTKQGNIWNILVESKKYLEPVVAGGPNDGKVMNHWWRSYSWWPCNTTDCHEEPIKIDSPVIDRSLNFGINTSC